jgi:hypothetical protein
MKRNILAIRDAPIENEINLVEMYLFLLRKTKKVNNIFFEAT